MREISIQEVLLVSGGDDEDSPLVQEVVRVVGQRLAQTQPWVMMGISASEYIFGPGYDQIVNDLASVGHSLFEAACNQQASDVNSAQGSVDLAQSIYDSAYGDFNPMADGDFDAEDVIAALTGQINSREIGSDIVLISILQGNLEAAQQNLANEQSQYDSLGCE